MKKILVLGSNGMAGHVISLYLEGIGYSVDKVARSQKVFKDTVLMDVTDFTALNELVSNGDYDCVINAVGILNADAENNHDKAVLLNSYLPNFLVSITKNIKTRVIHISTDCVFSGNKGGYVETDVTDTPTFYGKSKALGELSDNKNITLRTSIIGPDFNENAIGLFHWFMSSRNKGEISGYSKALWGGVTTIELAKAISKVINDDDISGLYHLTNTKSIDKFSLLNLFNKYFGSEALHISVNNEYTCDKSLKTANDVFIAPDYDTMIGEMREWINSNASLYSEYFKFLGGLMKC
jgi:dTDP-4-dehydrorhamnose reductase